MQENLKKIKRDNALKIFVSVAMVLVFCASLILAICAPVFNSDGVASAYDATLPSDGIPNPNFIKNSDFSKNTKGSSSYSSGGSVWTRVYDNWQILNADVSYAGDSVNVNFDTSTAAEYKRFCSTADYFYTLEPNNTYTLTLCYYVHELSGNVALRINNAYSSLYGSVYLKSGNPSVGLSTSSGLHITSCTFTLARSLPEGRVEIIAQANGTSFCNLDLYYFKLEEGSAFTGYVPDYERQIEDLQNQLIQANQDKKDLQDKVEDLENAFDYSFLNSLSGENLYFWNQSSPDKLGTGSYVFLPNASDTSLPEADRNFTCPITGYFSQTGNRPYLFGFQLPYEIPAGSTLRISYTCFCVGAGFSGVPFSELWRLGYTYGFYCGQFGYPTTDNIGQLVVVDSFQNTNGNIYIKLNQPTSYIAFDIVKRTNYSNKLVGYLTWTDDGVYSIVSSSTSGAQWFLGYNTLSAYYQGDMLTSAVDSARKDGYNQGYKEGKVVGEDIGFVKGVQTQGDYSFMGLLGAVFDAPIQAFKGLLSFEVLGVNMSAFVSSLFGLAVILLIFKLILGGGK